jgi:hypothetical protein
MNNPRKQNEDGSRVPIIWIERVWNPLITVRPLKVASPAIHPPSAGWTGLTRMLLCSPNHLLKPTTTPRLKL